MKLTREDVIDMLNQELSFVGADLSGLDLSYLDFSGVDLTNADLRECNLTATDFTGATLDNVGVYNAVWLSLVFPRIADMKETQLDRDESLLPEGYYRVVDGVVYSPTSWNMDISSS